MMKSIMRSVKEIGIAQNRSLRLGLLLVSSVLIIGASAMLYSGVTIERPLEVDNGGGISPAQPPGSNAPLGTSFVLVISAFLIGLGIFALLAFFFRRVGSAGLGRKSRSSEPAKVSSETRAWEDALEWEEKKNAAETT